MNFDNHPHADDLARLRKLAVVMDSCFTLPVGNIRHGWDAILGFVPVVGDMLTLAPSVFIIRESRRMGAPKPLLIRMGLNTMVDVVLGAIPLVGDIFDIGWQSKTRNVNLLHSYLAKAHQRDIKTPELVVSPFRWPCGLKNQALARPQNEKGPPNGSPFPNDMPSALANQLKTRKEIGDLNRRCLWRI